MFRWCWEVAARMLLTGEIEILLGQPLHIHISQSKRHDLEMMEIRAYLSVALRQI